MKADDIRKWAAEATEHFVSENDEKKTAVITAQALFEIAAQLAELNSNLRVHTAVSEGGDPRGLD